MVLQKSGRDGRNLPGFRDQFTKLEEYVPMLSEEMKAFVEHDLRLSMKVLDGMRTIGAIERADIEDKNTKRVENWIDARLSESQRRQLAKEAMISSREENHPLNQLSETNFSTHTQTLIELVSLLGWLLGKDPQCFCEEGENAIDEEDAVTSDNEKSLPVCKSCGKYMVVSTYSEGGYSAGYCCDICKGSSFEGLCDGSRERWHCSTCHTDFCFNCWPKERAMRVRSEDIALKAREGVTCMMKVLYSSTQSMPKWFILKALEKRMYPIFSAQIVRNEIHEQVKKASDVEDGQEEDKNANVSRRRRGQRSQWK